MSSKKRVDGFASEMDEGPPLNIEERLQGDDYIPAPSFSDAETQTEVTGQLLDQIDAELNEIRDEKEKLEKERDELMKESKRLQHLIKNPKFDTSNLRIAMKILNFTLVYPTGMPSYFYMIWSIRRHRA